MVPATSRFAVLLFDLGGVLVDFAGFAALGNLLSPRLDPAAVRARWIRSPAVDAFERGDLTPDQFAESFLAEWQLALAPQDFLTHFSAWNRGGYPGAYELLDRLSCREPRPRLACLSNASVLHATAHRARFGRYFDPFYLSNELRMTKPAPEVFAHVIADLGVPAPAIAYFDDTDVNVEAAARAGMHAVRVDGVEGTERALEALGLL